MQITINGEEFTGTTLYVDKVNNTLELIGTDNLKLSGINDWNNISYNESDVTLTKEQINDAVLEQLIIDMLGA